MIFYFSGTGNSRWVASEIARETRDEAADIADVNLPLDLSAEERIGIVFPIYSWGIPEPMIGFLEQIDLPSSAFVYGIGTCGAEAGLALKELAKLIPLNSSYSVAMPNNYVIASEIESHEAICEKIKKARSEISIISKEVSDKCPTSRVNKGAFAFLKSKIANWGFNRFARSTKPFWVTNSCNGCGLCAQQCPSRSIQIKNEKPIWAHQQCYQCLRCINECPKAAIQYGKATENRSRYSISRFLES